MWNFQRIDSAALLSGAKYIALTGSGGKTSFMEYLAKLGREAGKTVAITTTTKILAREPFALLGDGGFSGVLRAPLIHVGRNCEDGKLTGLTFEDLRELGSLFDLVLVEADGAKGMPLKFPAPYEPVIPPFSDRVFVLCGLDALGGRVDEYVFRWELFREATGTAGDVLITPGIIPRFFAPDILLKGVDPGRAIPVLNKYDVLITRSDAIEAAKGVINQSGISEVLVTSIHLGLFYSVAWR
jgi:probable selenium-dependent hydroxylase accessory protein YqeC